MMNHSEDRSSQASSIFNKYAEEYQNKFMNVDLYKDSLSSLCSIIPKKDSKVLDIACGPGNFTKYLLTHQPGLRILGIDLAPKMITLAQQNNPGAKFLVMDCRAISSLTEIYDVLICAFCLPYLSKPETENLIKDAYQLLSDEGIIYIATMEDDYSKSGLEAGSKGDLVFIHYYDKTYLNNLLQSVGFQVTQTFRVKNIMSNGKEVVDLIIIAKKVNGL